ncbi:MAG TPA: bifunctional GrpB family protein/GNAT family N-acetyltransferase [Solirubrobacteraceae bacterium]|jgi:ribosomal-protein-serine acetyltransferase|nr:bifunctional GrpB family protein/GNAT family N-acetyltransferase [Solirubrobacteraceae bacterium]
MSPSEQRRAAAEDLARAGAHDAVVQIVEYDPAWPAAFQAERERLAPLLKGVEIHHFGSTAVPGLAAKPVIDMIALVGDLDAPIDVLVQSAGYQFPRAFNATLAHRRFLCCPSASHRTHHLHLVNEHEELERRLRFRDRLRADPVLAGEYVRLKRALAERFPDDREAYTEAKSEFVREHDQPATAGRMKQTCRIELTEGRWLRLLEESDAQELYAAIEANREYLARWMPWAAGQTLDNTLAFIARTREQRASNDGFQTAVIEDGRIVGVVGFHGVSWQHRSTSIGYWLTKSAEGQGTVTRSVRALVDHALGTWRLHRVEIRVAVDNTRSRAIPERLGFTHEGVAREAEQIGDRYVDQAVYSMLASEWG